MIWIIATTSILLLFICIILSSKLRKEKSKNEHLNQNIITQEAIIRNSFEKEKRILLQEMELLEQQARVTQQSENAVMLMNAEGDICWVNDSFSRMYEYSYSEFTETLGSNIRQTSFSNEINERLRRCFSTKKPVVYDALNVTKTGKALWTRTSLIPLLDNTLTICGLVTIDSDIDNRVKASHSLVDYIHDFNRKTEAISGQLEALVEMTNTLFERIDISQRRIDRTDQIIDFIKGISDRTRILGINASIEAHSAGISGKGFRVISNEIVDVSNQTLNALKEIYELIEKIQRSSDKLGSLREHSEKAIDTHRNLIGALKSEINEVESIVLQMD